MIATMRKTSFDLVPLNPIERCTPLSVAAHTLYEKTRADLLAGPGGVLDLNAATYEALDPRTVRVRGSEFRPTRYTVKLEGAKIVGHRTIFIGGIRDPILIAQIDTYLDNVRKYVGSFHEMLGTGEAQLVFHVYGKNGVMGALEPVRNAIPHELCILCEAPYPGQLATGGNMAFPLTPMENEIGPVCAFTIYHLMEVDDPVTMFPMKVMEF